MGIASPLTIEAFPGHTRDIRTVAASLSQLQQRFGAQNLSLVGD
jgi:hypothetical protein